ncbi:hypothetical protein [Thalassomonas haliotis]|uniref:Cytochrome c domain-containing protein n=1 Tax=Thalassomonas haliotis TaxID=485448 RepID=A0ABY7VHB6_9GAMM|nr:hypothetical protein [Thalassomonas haliotis]WDE12609.1 hypothetical protein H3N35_03780 [Thalassomonas haliotis]
MLIAGLSGISFISSAEPYLAVKNNLPCAACHSNPNGGGLRNDFGRIYGQSVLPAKASALDTTELAKINQYFTLGANARFNANFQKTDEKENNTSRSFEVASTQLYLNIKMPETGLSFYLDQQVAPGSAINREAFVIYQFDDQDFIKAGKLYLPYGLRIEDDSAFIRQASGMNFDNSDNGVEYGLNFADSDINFYMANGTSQASNNDNSFLYGIRAEHRFSSFRIGTTALLNDGDRQTQMLNLYGGAQWGNVTFLAEVDYIKLETLTDEDIGQLASLAEINFQWRPGWNIKLTAEYFDPDNGISENEQSRYSLIGEYTPLSNIQLRFGVRVKQDIPQKPQQNHDLAFIQSHFYF